MTGYQLIKGSAHDLSMIDDETVQTCVTSPPYWGLREYAGEQEFVWSGDPEHEHEWGDRLPTRANGGQHNFSSSGLKRDGRSEASRRRTLLEVAKENERVQPVTAGQFCACGAWRGALGLEPTPDLYVEHMVAVFREVGRVLKPDGTLWLNLGDSYAAGGMSNPSTSSTLGGGKDRGAASYSLSRSAPAGLKPKDLVGIPWRVAFALQSDGWYLRSDIIWAKPNPMPESVTDRPTKAHEYIFLLSKSPRYYYEADAVREARTDITQIDGRGGDESRKRTGNPTGTHRNARTVWEIATQPYPGAHFATFPRAIPERCIKAGSAPGDLVLDPFNGSGTTGRAAVALGRRYVGVDVSDEYLDLALERIDPITATAKNTDQGTLL